MELKKEWERKLLGDVVELKRGYDLPKRLREDGPVPLISSAGVSDFHREYKVKGPGVVTGRYGTIGKVFYSESDFWPLNTTLYVRDFKSNDPKFIYYFLKTINYLQFSDKAAVPGVNRNHLHMAEVFVPASVAEQKAIAHILGTLDDKIEVNRRMNETLEGMAQALFKSWFVDFDPVIDNALAAGHDIPEALQCKALVRQIQASQPHPPEALPRDIRQAFPAAFEFSETMGWIPEGWSVATVGEEFNLTMGQSPPGSTYNEEGEGIAFFQGRSDFGFRYPKNRIYCTAPKRLASKGDTLISVRAPVGDVNMAAEDCCIGRGVSSAHHKSQSRSFTYYSMLQLRENFKVFEAEGTVFGSINKTDFKALLCLKISEELVASFEKYSGSLDQKIETNSQAIINLSKLRDTLLPKLLSGELRIPDAEKQVEKAL